MITVGVDDSEIPIEGRRHRILAVVKADPEDAAAAIHDIRQKLGIPPSVEFKWNGMDLARDQRETLSAMALDFLGDSIGLVTLTEVDAADPAQLCVEQIRAYARAIEAQAVRAIFDVGILPRGMQTADQAVALATAPSHDEPLIQWADLYAGFTRITIQYALGAKADRDLVVEHPALGEIDLSLSDLIHQALRYTLWGDVATADAVGMGPVKVARGRGLRIVSNRSSDVVEQIYRYVGEDFIGCMV